MVQSMVLGWHAHFCENVKEIFQ